MYKIVARFEQEKPFHTDISVAKFFEHKKSDCIIELSNLPSKKTLKEIVTNHYQQYNGKVFGKILFYELYNKNEILYKINTFGEIVENYRLIRMLIHNCRINAYLKQDLDLVFTYKELFFELYDNVYNLVEKYDPFGIAGYGGNEYEPEIRDIVRKLLNKKLSQKKIFNIIKNVFEDWFYPDENRNAIYNEIAKEIYDFYVKKVGENEWFVD